MSDAYRGAEAAEFLSQRDAMSRLVPKAVSYAMLSPCAKSKRGALLVDMNARVYSQRGVVVGHGFNAPPGSDRCDGSDACRAACGRRCEHAEAAAIRNALEGPDSRGSLHGLHMLHVKAHGHVAVSSNEPSCERCSVTMLAHGIGVMWLLTSTGLRAWDMADFHETTTRNLGLPVIR